MVSQILFGETFKVVSVFKGWAKVICDHDGYEGWIDQKQLTALSSEEHALILAKSKHFSTELVHELNQKDAETLNILPGSVLYDASGSEFMLGDKRFSFSGKSINADTKSSYEKLKMNALLYLNSPYLWGGRTPFGIDCSGFVQNVARLSGISLPRDTGQQAEVGEMINLISEAKPGDLAFFDNAEGRIIHVGLLLDNGQIIHASGKVRIDTIDHQGIFKKETNKYSHQLRVIKRIID